MSAQPVFDGHNDVLLRMYLQEGGDAIAEFLAGAEKGHLDLKKARAGGFAGGMFAVFVPPEDKPDAPPRSRPGSGIEMPLPPELDINYARKVTIGEIAVALKLEAASNGAIGIARSVADIRRINAAGGIAIVLHIEGIEAVDAELEFLHVLYAAGLRSLGPVWSRANVFGTGVPFKFPGDPDIGPGLTEAGKNLVRTCNQLGIMIDMSHLNEKGFWDIAELSTAPLVTTHSNVHALCQTPRNLTDRQLDAIKESKGMVGLNYAVAFLREDGKSNADTPIERMVDHLAYMVDRMGETSVGLGSDFDGALIPNEIGDASGLPRLIDAMKARGFGDELVSRIAYGNWLDLLERTIG